MRVRKFATVGLLVSMVTLARSVGASAQAASNRGPQFLLASAAKLVPVDIDRTPVLQRRIALDLGGATIKEALAEISARSGLRLAYSDDLVRWASGWISGRRRSPWPGRLPTCCLVSVWMWCSIVPGEPRW